MGRSKRAKAAAKAAKRIPIVGTAVSIEPLVEAAAETINSGNFTSMQTWSNFIARVRYKYLGVTNSGQVDGNRIVLTWLPIGGYLIARRTGLSKPISRALGKIGLRF